MTKRELRNAAGKAIWKEKKSHQETFDELKQHDYPNDSLAELVSKVPSNGKMEKTKVLRYSLIAVLILIIIVRSLSVISLIYLPNLNMGVILLALAGSLLAPGFLIYAAVSKRSDFYLSGAILFGVTTLRMLTKEGVEINPYSIGYIVLVVAAIVLCLVLYKLIKTPYSTETITKESEGKTTTSIAYIFEDSRLDNTQVIDADL